MHPPFLSQVDLVVSAVFFQPKGEESSNEQLDHYLHPILFFTDQTLLFLGLGVGGACWPAPFIWLLLSPAVYPPLPHDPCGVRETPQIDV